MRRVGPDDRLSPFQPDGSVRPDLKAFHSWLRYPLGPVLFALSRMRCRLPLTSETQTLEGHKGPSWSSHLSSCTSQATEPVCLMLSKPTSVACIPHHQESTEPLATAYIYYKKCWRGEGVSPLPGGQASMSHEPPPYLAASAERLENEWATQTERLSPPYRWLLHGSGTLAGKDVCEDLVSRSPSIAARTRLQFSGLPLQPLSPGLFWPLLTLQRCREAANRVSFG